MCDVFVQVVERCYLKKLVWLSLKNLRVRRILFGGSNYESLKVSVAPRIRCGCSLEILNVRRTGAGRGALLLKKVSLAVHWKIDFCGVFYSAGVTMTLLRSR